MHYHGHKSPQLYPVFIQVNPVHFSTYHHNVIFPSAPRLRSFSLCNFLYPVIFLKSRNFHYFAGVMNCYNYIRFLHLGVLSWNHEDWFKMYGIRSLDVSRGGCYVTSHFVAELCKKEHGCKGDVWVRYYTVLEPGPYVTVRMACSPCGSVWRDSAWLPSSFFFTS
jgi:hypothetical protein